MTTQITEESYPLSHIQQGMLFHYLKNRRSGVDIEQIVCDLHESLDVPTFRRAWEWLVARHPNYRTHFVWEGLDEPLQIVHLHADFPFTFHDVQHMAATEQRAQITSYLHSDRLTGFELTRHPLMRGALFQLRDADYTFVWSFHHLLQDGRSFPIVLHELFTCYEAFLAGQQPCLSQPRPYKDYIAWLRQRDMSRDEVFWRQFLSGYTTPTLLLNTQVQTPENGHPVQRGEQEISLSVETTSRLRELARQHNITLNTFVQGAWGLLLSRYSGEDDVVFGGTRSGRRSALGGEGTESMVGVFINTLPVRVRVLPQRDIVAWLQELRQQQVAVRDYEHTPLVNIHRWSDVPQDMPLFESNLVFDNTLLHTEMQTLGGYWEQREFRLLERTNFPITLYGYAEQALILKLSYDRPRFHDDVITRVLGHLTTLLESIASNPKQQVGTLPMLTQTEQRRFLETWNATEINYPKQMRIHELFEAQVECTPDATAVIYKNSSLTYRELNVRANQLARHLQHLEVGPDVLVGIHVERSLEMMVGVLGVLKAGGAYVPLDPEYPLDRLRFVVDDAGIKVLLTQHHHAAQIAPASVQTIYLDTGWDTIGHENPQNITSDGDANCLAYVIYTSGSTGRPKGVMLEHRNVVNFFVGMDASLGFDKPGSWLAVTSLSFDISVLELLWTLTRGFRVVLYADERKELSVTPRRQLASSKPIDFSLFYFASDEGEEKDNKYRLLLEGAKFADENGFTAVWTPERHFHAFGGLYPNPAVTGAALATVTKNVQIRAGSVVLPLHHPIRVAEEWALVDNLSGGRVGVSIASGWHPNDFVLAPQNFADRKGTMFRYIDAVRALWRGEAIAFANPKGDTVEIRTLPRPIQAELPVWVTTAGDSETYRMAGEVGANVLTHLLGQTVEELGEKIAVYRKAYQASGHDGRGQVSLMLHTFVGEDKDVVRETVRQPMINYLRSSVSLIKNFAASWTAYSRRAGRIDLAADDEFQNLSKEDMEALLNYSFERYFETSGLFGTPEMCLAMIDKLKAAGVDDVACLIDFGVDASTVLKHLTYLNSVRMQANSRSEEEGTGASFAQQLVANGVTHLQCTPSMASMLIASDESRQALASLHKVMIGGEAFPVSLAKALKEKVRGNVINMYGPTETTIWSSTHVIDDVANTIPIGRPIANTEFYILDKHMQPVPIGVAGELFIGGAGVARGYLNRPELTAEKFIPHPFRATPQARLYRTGDLACYRGDGSVEFLGRVDYQVKIRGYRIELGEIEALLEEHPAVGEAVVVAREDTLGDKRLVAYLVPNQLFEVTAHQLQDYLKERLPDYMVPSRYVLLDTFPLTANAKIDRKALPAPENVRVETARPLVAPENELERTIAEIWQEVLDITKVGTQDNFFELGGHSLLTVQVHNKLRLATGQDLAITDLFRFPTIKSLAGYLAQTESDTTAMQQGHTRAETRRRSMIQRRNRRLSRD